MDQRGSTHIQLAASRQPHLRILHFDGVYNVKPISSEEGGLVRFQTLVNRIRDLGGSNQPPPLTFFSGDAINPSLESILTRDCACIGNHELDFGAPHFQKLTNDCKFPWLYADLLGPDLVLTHQREPNGRKLARQTNGTIDIILGDYDNIYGHEVNWNLHRSGSDFRQFSSLELRGDEKRPGKWNIPIYRNYVTEDVPEDSSIMEWIEKLHATFRPEFEKPVCYSSVDLDSHFEIIRTQETNWGNFITDVCEHIIELTAIFDAPFLLNTSAWFSAYREASFAMCGEWMKIQGEEQDPSGSYTLATRDCMARGKDNHSALLAVSAGVLRLPLELAESRASSHSINARAKRGRSVIDNI
ncbi:Metallo-dependent phosphatase [Zopfia rhizophila CBS 207.26]|uniref:Metallo-dependent phosphatase n=1 Tax=Zopfia rhizophila CBS 207.26 TaxID=1314779 RepID=A0A6A6DTB9_9PEZI|nr:Metallo-dependent phosphatase [Zopfia rhizophila CBS 207.26]